ncbi:tetratricopeptide repeat protein [Aquimarina rubra]|uniref:Tetratricopeptide repeat protein n=1 Tax=Aquimarina rubra TaxID=1920033 RepID=A0ABW5LLI0_9FLAO
MKKLKKLSKSFRTDIGPHQIEIAKNENWQGISGDQPIFFFDFFAIGKPLRYNLTSYIAELCEINISSADIVWVDGQDKFLKDGLLSFWFWDQNDLIPFAFIGKEAHKGPFHPIDGVLFLNTNTGKEPATMEILLLSTKREHKLTRVANKLDDLSIIKTNPDRGQSEQIKQEGNGLFGQGNFDGAAEKFYEAMLVDPTNPNPYNNMGMITQVAKILPKRGEFFTQLSYLVDPEYTNGMRGYSGYPASQGNFKKSIKLIKKCVEIEPSAQNYGILARFYFDAGKYKKAQHAGEEALQLDPDHTEALDIMAKLPL